MQRELKSSHQIISRTERTSLSLNIGVRSRSCHRVERLAGCAVPRIYSKDAGPETMRLLIAGEHDKSSLLRTAVWDLRVTPQHHDHDSACWDDVHMFEHEDAER